MKNGKTGSLFPHPSLSMLTSKLSTLLLKLVTPPAISICKVEITSVHDTSDVILHHHPVKIEPCRSF